MLIAGKLIDIKPFHEYGRHCLKLDEAQIQAVSEFNNRIQNKEIVFEEVPCLCGNDQFSLVASVDRYGLIQSTVLCKECGLMQSIPRMTKEYYQFFYESDEYRRLYNGNDFVHSVESHYTDGRGDAIYQTITRHKNLDEIKTVLEFGAGGGWNLLPFVRRGISVKGYDFSKELVSVGRGKGINLAYGGLDDIDGQYDVIIVNHVIEHFTDFLSDIKKLKSHLKEDGIMYVAVPDIRHFSMEQLQNAHTYYFTLETLEYYMGTCDLRVVHHQSEPGGHMSAIFVIGEPQRSGPYLQGHYEHMVRMLRRYNRRYYPRRFLISLLDSVGLKNNLKRLYSYFAKK